MEAPQQESENPLGLSLDFMFGRGYLWAERQRLSDWIALESMRMEIPDLQFPFDARGGLERFRHTRCLVREVEVAISEVGLGDLLVEAADGVEGFEGLEIRFLEDAAHISVQLSSFGAETQLSFRAALIPPEPARADEVHLSLYDYRAFGPLPYPARLVVHELLTGLLNTPILRSPGRGDSFTVGIAGDIVRFRPLKLLFLHIFPRVGWKLPNLSGVVLEGARIRPGVMILRAVDDDPQSAARAGGADFELAGSKEGARALAAYEAKELFSHADRALFDGEIRQALSLLSNYRDVYGLHPALVARLLDCLVADASPANLAEAESIRRELVAEDEADLQAALVAPNLAIARRREEEAIEAFEALAEALEKRSQTRDWMLCQRALARRLADDRPEEAAARLREVLKRDPRHRQALEALRTLYDRLGEPARLEETLKRLTGVYTDRETLKQIYLDLAHHLMDRQGDLAEARMYLEKVLRLDATELDALHALGESYVVGGEPLRALKAFGSAARSAEASGRMELAGRLHFRVGELWYQELEDPRQALLGFRRSLELGKGEGEQGEVDDPLRRAHRLRRAAEMCEELSRNDDAAGYWREAVTLLERAGERRRAPAFDDDEQSEQGDRDWQQDLVVAHRHLGRIYDQRQRPAAAASHFRRVLEADPGDRQALQWLEEHLRRAGRPEELIALYRELADEADEPRDRAQLIRRRADLYAQLGHVDEAAKCYRRVLDADPSDEAAREQLVDLLREYGRFEDLRDALNTVLVRTRDKAAQQAISMELGAAAEALDDHRRAVRSYMEALRLKAGDRETLEAVCRALGDYVEQRGVTAPAPVGEKAAGRLLESVLIQLAEVTPSVVQQREALLEVAMLADERGDSAAAAEARERAEALDGIEGGDSDYEGVDARLDAMLDEFDEGGEQRPSATVDDATDGDDAGGRPARRSTRSTPASDEKVESFRRRFASMLEKPADLKRQKEGDSSPLSQILERSKERTPAGADEDEMSKEPATVKIPVADLQSARSEAPEAAEVSDDENTLPTPGETAGEAAADTDVEYGEAGGDSADSGWTVNLPDKKSLDEQSDIDTSPDIHPVEIGLDALDELRVSGDPREVAQAIEQVLMLAENTDTEVLEADLRQSLSKEVGELLYYELEDGEAARPYLEAVHRLDPDGEGAAPEVVNALETIYEQQGDVSARVNLLQRRLANTDDEQMQITYRLLLGQLFWDQARDVDAARHWIDEVLSTEPHHEGAHRLLAEIAEEQQDWEAVVRHLKVVVNAGSGGIEAVEARRKLAQIHLHQREAPAEARTHFEQVLDEAPGDSQALEGMKNCQALLGQWPQYLESLARELGLLTGATDGFSLEEMVALEPSSLSSPLRVPASEIVSDAAYVAEEEMDNPRRARQLWGLAYRLWPEQVEALERRIELDRQIDAHRDLADDLETYAGAVLDAHDRFEALVEAARIRASKLDDADGARPLYAEALALVRKSDDPPDGVDQVRRALERLDARNQS